MELRFLGSIILVALAYAPAWWTLPAVVLDQEGDDDGPNGGRTLKRPVLDLLQIGASLFYVAPWYDELMENGDDRKLQELEQKVDRIWRSVESMRKMYLWTLIIGVAVIVLPLIGLLFALPALLKTFDVNSLLN